MLLIFKLLIALGILLLLRFILSLNKWIMIKKYYKAYLDYLKNSTLTFSEKKHQIIALFKDAGIHNFAIPVLKPAGYGQLLHTTADGFENITYTDYEVVVIMHNKFHEAIGVFRHRVLQTVNPVFWIEFVFKLPEYVFEYFGLKADNFVVKLMQVIYWIVGIIIGLEKLKIIDLFKSV